MRAQCTGAAAARRTARRLNGQLIFDLIPKRRAPQAFLDVFAQRTFVSIDAQAVSHVVENRLGKRIGALEDHAHAACANSRRPSAKFLAVKQNLTLEPRVPDGFLHTIQSCEGKLTCRTRKGRSAR